VSRWTPDHIPNIVGSVFVEEGGRKGGWGLDTHERPSSICHDNPGMIADPAFIKPTVSNGDYRVHAPPGTGRGMLGGWGEGSRLLTFFKKSLLQCSYTTKYCVKKQCDHHMCQQVLDVRLCFHLKYLEHLISRAAFQGTKRFLQPVVVVCASTAKIRQISPSMFGMNILFSMEGIKIVLLLIVSSSKGSYSSREKFL